MPAITIPPRYEPGLRALAGLNDEQAERLHATLVDMPSRLTTSRLAEHVGVAVPELEVEALDIVEAVLSLVALMPEGADEADIAGQVAQEVSAATNLNLGDATRDSFANRLRGLLQLEPVAIAARAQIVSTDSERVYHDSRVFTDLRPVFGADASLGAKAATLVATLKIEAHEGGRRMQPYYFALDHEDLLHLHGVIDRALVKAGEIKRMAEQLQLPFWEYAEVDDAADS